MAFSFGGNKTIMPKFQPGQSGNPAGRPKVASLREAVQRKMSRSATVIKFAEMLVNTAISPKEPASVRLQAAKLIIEYLEGKPAPRPAAKQDNGKLQVIFEDANNQAA